MARFKNRDILVLQNEEVLFGDAQEASLKYDGSNLLINQLLEHTVDGPYATREWVESTVAKLEWQDSVIDYTSSEPPTGSTTTGDRYIISPSADANTKLLLHFDEPSFTDSSNFGYGISNGGGVTRSSTQSQFGGYAGYFDGTTGAYLQIEDSSDWDVGANDFTIEVWAYPTTVAGNSDIISRRLTGLTRGFTLIRVGAQWRFYATSNDSTWDICNAVVIGTAVQDTWQHLAVVRSGNNFYTFKDGVPGGTAVSALAITIGQDVLRLGSVDNSYTWTGYLDEHRFSSSARWTSDFSGSLPAEPYGLGGNWAGYENNITEWEGSTWSFTTPSAGFAAWVDNEGFYRVWNESAWIKFGGVVDHGALQGLADDDHTQYLLADGSRAADVLTVTAALTAAEIQVSQGAEDDEAILFRSTDVAHGITTVAETDIYGHLAKADADLGGVGLWGFSEGTIGSSLYSYYGDATGDTDKDTTALGAITLYTLQASGTGVQDVGATDNIFVLRPRRSGALSSSLIADGSGNLYIDGDYRSFGTTLDVLTSNNYGMSIAADGTITFTGSVSGTDHGLLTGLADDDHTQYYHTDGRRSWSGALTVESSASELRFLEDTATIGVLSNTDLMSLAPTAVTFDGDIYCNTLHSASASVIIGGVTLSDVGGVLTVDSVISSPSGSGGGDYATIDFVDAGLLLKSDTTHDHDAEYYTKALAVSTFSPIASGVTGGDAHNHDGGDGAQIDHVGLANKGTNTHAQIDTHVGNLNSHNNTYHSDTFITATGVTFEALNGAGDVGTASTQVAQGDHSHGVADGVWILIEKQTASNDNTIDFTGISGYSKVFFTLEQVVPGNDIVDTCMRVYTGASTLQTGAIYTSAEFIWTNVGGTGANGETNGTTFYLTEHTSVGSAANEYGVSGEVKFWGFNGSKYKHATTHLYMWRSDGYNVGITGAGRMQTTTVLTGVQFYFSAGTVESGTICCYGIKDA